MNTRMIRIESARTADHKALERLLAVLGYDEECIDVRDYWVAREEGAIIGAAKVESHGAAVYLGSVGVAPERRGTGVATQLLKGVIAAVDRPVFCYTVIPEFFQRFGFEPTAPSPAIPTRAEIGCEGCDPVRCVCMVRYPA